MVQVQIIIPVIDLPLSEETFDNFEKIRLQVLSELREYYRHEMKLDDFSNRLGNLLIIAHGAGVSLNISRVFLHLIFRKL